MGEEGDSRQRAVILEEETALLLAGKRTPGSGSKSIKGDVESAAFLAECKYRAFPKSPDRIGVELSWLETIHQHAARVGKIPLLVVETGDADRAVLLPLEEYLRLADLEFEEVHFLGECAYRVLILGADEWALLPFFVRLTRIERIPATDWAVISWGEMRELRRQHQVQSVPKSLKRSARPAVWRQRPFR